MLTAMDSTRDPTCPVLSDTGRIASRQQACPTSRGATALRYEIRFDEADLVSPGPSRLGPKPRLVRSAMVEASER